MKITMNCDSANKLVKSLTADRESLLVRERNTAKFTSTTADRENDRPEYDFRKTQEELDFLAEKIFALKHAINVFNTTTVLSAGYTIDEALVRMAVLSEKKRRFEAMRNEPEKHRAVISSSGVPEYVFRNYTIEEVENEYRKTNDELVELQQALNIANLTKTFEVDLP